MSEWIIVVKYIHVRIKNIKRVLYLILKKHEKKHEKKQEVKVIWQKAPHGEPIPQLVVTSGGRKLYHWIPGVGVPISVP